MPLGTCALGGATPLVECGWATTRTAVGAAFAPVIATLVKNVVMLPIGLLLGGVDFSNLGVVLGGGEYASVAAAITPWCSS